MTTTSTSTGKMMSTGTSTGTMLSRRQINIQRENLSSMCRISVKSLLDYACLYTHVNDDSEEFINFCAVFEQLVSHRLRPHQKKVWLPGQATPRYFWDVLLDNYNITQVSFCETCIPNIEAIEAIRSPKAKLRAFIRVALMEKRLSDYLYCLLDNTRLIHESYLEGAIMASEEALVLCGELIGLNAIDFSFCLKGGESELLGPLEISYSPFISFKQTSASRCSDEIEMLHLSGKEVKSTDSSLSDVNIQEMLHFQSFEKDMRHIKEQKDYLEELLRLRERQLAQANLKIDSMTTEWQLAEKSREKEHATMEDCVLKLQKDIAKLQKSNRTLKVQVTSLKHVNQREVKKEEPIVDVTMDRAREMNQSDAQFYVEHFDARLGMTQELTKELSQIPSEQKDIEMSNSGKEHTDQGIASETLTNLQSEIVTHTNNVIQVSNEEMSPNQPAECVLSSQKKRCDIKSNIQDELEEDHIVSPRETSEEENEIKISDTSMILMESYILTQEVDILDPARSKYPENSVHFSQFANENAAVDSFEHAESDTRIPSLSNESSRHGEVSESTMVNVGNNSEAAWEMLPMLEQND
uniref:RUN domain-containing protein n=1 Tax=Arion vulgaris TaxID=1028688 RepID=A0A0B7A2A8_9EUPU